MPKLRWKTNKKIANSRMSENLILQEKLSQMERENERNKDIQSQFDAKKNTSKRMHTQSTTEIQTSLTETLLDKEEEEPTEVSNPDEKTQTDENIPNTEKEKTTRSRLNGTEQIQKQLNRKYKEQIQKRLNLFHKFVREQI